MKRHADDKMEAQESKNKQKLLVVGEGDFSFSLSLAKVFGSATNITASLDIREELGRQYNKGKTNVEELERLGCTVVRGVNVHSMTLDDRLAQYDIIVFNFPHAGKRKEIVRGFLKSVKEMVKDKDGEIHITCNTIYPFNKSDIKTIAEENGLRLIRKMQFKKWTFLSNSNNRGTIENNCDYSLRMGSTVTFMFQES